LRVIEEGRFMKISESKMNGALLIAVSGRVDSAATEEMERAFQSVLERGEKWLVVDLAGVDYISSAGLGAFVGLSKKVKAAKGQARFCAPSKLVRQVFDLTGVSLRLDMFATQAEALADFPPA
jgi:anti-anti-sigma factor